MNPCCRTPGRGTPGRTVHCLNSGHFLRAALMPALFRELGITTGIGAVHTTTVRFSATAGGAGHGTADDPPLAPLFKVCGACHRPMNPFPPNFLAGNADQVRRTVAHVRNASSTGWACGPGASQRPKSPMPPQHAGSPEGARLAQWTNGLLKELRQALSGVATTPGAVAVTCADTGPPYYTCAAACRPVEAFTRTAP